MIHRKTLQTILLLTLLSATLQFGVQANAACEYFFSQQFANACASTEQRHRNRDGGAAINRGCNSCDRENPRSRK